ncbi:GNAT family N-acetyltransferase [Sporolituus thermophilus]|uniref:Predicted N-acetyltransferase YhbS n=1 Tax=Sporolituus thermophilus DSM 23256 TaxID=1123285 RepID=A0A1G7N638_9FIRM|nr:GNAT family N-acetyltransferase [Sporolituus thermophilus]SDF69548.1 Predicted N-acetyltransferase YhbS [Sporolituus thermophilus DSM 23256]
MENRLIIRPAAEGDLPAIFALYGELAKAYDQKDDSGEAWREAWQDKRQHILVAERDGEIVGTLTCIVIPNLGHGGQPWAALTNVVVAAAHRGQGIGTALMAEASRLAKAANCYKIVLSSNLVRTEAHEFYRRLGWRQTHIGFSLE